MTAENSRLPKRGKKQTRKITKQVIDWLSAEAKTTGEALLVWDSELKGYIVRAGKNGHISGAIQWWSGGRDGRPPR